MSATHGKTIGRSTPRDSIVGVEGGKRGMDVGLPNGLWTARKSSETGPLPHKDAKRRASASGNLGLTVCSLAYFFSSVDFGDTSLEITRSVSSEIPKRDPSLNFKPLALLRTPSSEEPASSAFA
ncbi:hypothetical protein AXF42_Ash018818 [Apostasia shenzhenica]|uniref:Uncharacterized protein n=1 Tax=Apostasia shenzhenica TaxID=1088818 RepID=A0A2I0B153_9ASPA|nr:hypothetical protein AXF42_Ash018818 [Apostasia shenzhenica]